MFFVVFFFSQTSSLLFFWSCSSDLAVSKFGWFFCVLCKSWFLNVTDDCVGFGASRVSCQIVKAIIPPQAAGVTIQHCPWEDSPAAWWWQIVLSFHFPPPRGILKNQLEKQSCYNEFAIRNMLIFMSLQRGLLLESSSWSSDLWWKDILVNGGMQKEF